MQKIYLDWDCIENSAYKYKIQRCVNFFWLQDTLSDHYISPYSTAHLKDFLQAFPEKNKSYMMYLNIFSIICGNHFLSLDKKPVHPCFVTPKELVKQPELLAKTLQQTETFSYQSLVELKQATKELVHEELFNQIQNADATEAISLIHNYLEEQLPEKDLSTILLHSVSREKKELIRIEAQFKRIGLALELLDCQEPGSSKKFNELDTDSQHIFNAIHCDYLVSGRNDFRDRAKALYTKYQIHTKVYRPYKMLRFMNKAYNRHFYSEIHKLRTFNKYGIPQVNKDGIHYPKLPFPILDNFTTCVKMTEYPDKKEGEESAIYCKLPNYIPYVFQTEMEKFRDMFIEDLQGMNREDFKDKFNRYFIQCDSSEEHYFYQNLVYPFLDMIFAISPNPLAAIPIPMLQVKAGKDCERLVEKYQYESYMNEISDYRECPQCHK